MQKDYILVGQGLAGTVLAYTLLKEGASVFIYSDNEASASHVAAGMYNPVTGKRMTKTWRANELFPFMEAFYKEMETEFNANFLFPKKIYKPFSTIEEQNTWMSATDDPEYIDTSIPKEKYERYLKSSIGGYETFHSGHLEVAEMIRLFRNILENTNSIKQEIVDFESIQFHDEGVTYKGVTAKKIIFCDGVKALKNPFFSWLPFYPSKGEVLEVEIADFPKEVIFSKQVFILPQQSGNYKVGSTYAWEYDSSLPTDAGKEELIGKLDQMIKMPFILKDHRAGIRPTVKDRKPMIGFHPEVKQLGMFNGLGTKGVSIAPFFAHNFAEHLLYGKQLDQEVNIERFYSLYSHSKV